MEDHHLENRIQTILKGLESKNKVLRELKEYIFEKQPGYYVDFHIVVPSLQNSVEDIFDEILLNYTKSRLKDEYQYHNEIMKLMAVDKKPEIVRSEIIFNLGFVEKKNLVYKVFKIPKQTREIIDKLNEIRNAIAHRYSKDDKRFFYKQKNILDDHETLNGFFTDCMSGILEILNLNVKLLEVVNKVERELG